MAKKMKKVLAMFLAVLMLSGTMLMATPAVAAEADSEYTIALIPGKTTSAKRKVNDENGSTTYTITAETSDITVDAKQTAADFVGPQSALKFDRNDSADQTAQRKVRDLYTDNGHFTDPDTITVTDAPEGYPFQYVGTGDYSGHYVSHMRVIYERDEAGNPVEDPDGNYVIKELQHANGTPLTILDNSMDFIELAKQI